MLFWMLFLGVYEGGQKGIFYARDHSIYSLLISCLAKSKQGAVRVRINAKCAIRGP